jgi:hypothetical protein
MELVLYDHYPDTPITTRHNHFYLSFSNRSLKNKDGVSLYYSLGFIESEAKYTFYVTKIM